MALDPTQVQVGYSGYAYIADVGTVAPTDPFTAPGTGWVNLGLITDDGLTEALNEDRTEFMAWGVDSPVRTQVKNRKSTFKLSLMQTNAYALSLYFGVAIADMTSAGTGATQFLEFDDPINVKPDVRTLCLDVVDGDFARRFVIARAEITDRGDISYKDDQTIDYEFTFTALADSIGASGIHRMFGGVALPA